jgi:hypothetical protein
LVWLVDSKKFRNSWVFWNTSTWNFLHMDFWRQIFFFNITPEPWLPFHLYHFLIDFVSLLLLLNPQIFLKFLEHPNKVIRIYSILIIKSSFFANFSGSFSTLNLSATFGNLAEQRFSFIYNNIRSIGEKVNSLSIVAGKRVVQNQTLDSTTWHSLSQISRSPHTHAETTSLFTQNNSLNSFIKV